MTRPSGPPAPVHHLDEPEQAVLLGDIVSVLDKAPWFRPHLPRWGTPFSVLMSNCGPLGWVADKSGYRYQPHHPDTSKPWPSMPQTLLDLWDSLTGYPAPPEACLINFYGHKAKMGLHQDKDEDDFDAPVLSVSLGDEARFRQGGLERKGPTQSVILKSGDIVMLAGKDRLAYHGIDRVYPGTSDILGAWPQAFPGGGRVNLTLRRVTKPD